MSTSPAAFSPKKGPGLTLTEILATLVILGVICAMVPITWGKRIETEYAQNASLRLMAVYQAEESFFAWKNRYTSDWVELNLTNPNTVDPYYQYNIEVGSGTALLIRATRTGSSGTGLTIDQTGTVSKF